MNITVYCGSRPGTDPAFAESAGALGRWIAGHGYGMVYGGGNIGLMEVIADTVLKNGGHVTGVIPEFLLEHEIGHEGLHTLEIVKDMPERKRRMIELGDAFIAMPGGTGTLEEISEVISMQKLDLHEKEKPCVFFNVNGFYEPLREMLRRMAGEEFITQKDFERIFFIDRPEDLERIL